jgi:hypothetical protein
MKNFNLIEQVSSIMKIFPEVGDTVKWFFPSIDIIKGYKWFAFPNLDKLGLDYWSAVQRVFSYIEFLCEDRLKIRTIFSIDKNRINRTRRVRLCIQDCLKFQENDSIFISPCNIEDYKGFSPDFVYEHTYFENFENSIAGSINAIKFLPGLFEMAVILLHDIQLNGELIFETDVFGFLCGGDRYYENGSFSYVPAVYLMLDKSKGKILINVTYFSAKSSHNNFSNPSLLIWEPYCTYRQQNKQTTTKGERVYGQRGSDERSRD